MMDTTTLLGDSYSSALMDVGNSRIDLNTVHDLEGYKLSAINRNITRHGKIVLCISIIALICSLSLFISSVVIYNQSQSIVAAEACSLDAFFANVQEQKAIAASQGKLVFNSRHDLKKYLEQSITATEDPNATKMLSATNNIETTKL